MGYTGQEQRASENEHEEQLTETSKQRLQQKDAVADTIDDSVTLQRRGFLTVVGSAAVLPAIVSGETEATEQDGYGLNGYGEGSYGHTIEDSGDDEVEDIEEAETDDEEGSVDSGSDDADPDTDDSSSVQGDDTGESSSSGSETSSSDTSIQDGTTDLAPGFGLLAAGGGLGGTAVYLLAKEHFSSDIDNEEQ